MGVPVVTRAGSRQAERMTYSLLAHLGVTATVAHNDDDYVAIAVRLARDRRWRDAVAAEILAALPISGLADADGYTRSLEGAYERALAQKTMKSDWKRNACICTSSASAGHSWAGSPRSPGRAAMRSPVATQTSIRR